MLANSADLQQMYIYTIFSHESSQNQCECVRFSGLLAKCLFQTTCSFEHLVDLEYSTYDHHAESESDSGSASGAGAEAEAESHLWERSLAWPSS